MLSPHQRLYFLVSPLIVLGCALLIPIEPNSPPGIKFVLTGYLLGTMFGQATLAAAWAALGRGRIIWRVPLSLGWILVTMAALAANSSVREDEGVLIAFAACLFGQWLLVQMTLWTLAWIFGIQLQQTERAAPASARSQQFGIGQLMIFTAIVGGVLGVGRLLVPRLVETLSVGESPIFLFLAAVAIAMTLPLLLAALLQRYALLAVLIVLALIVAGTFWEMPLLVVAMGRPGPGPLFMHLVWINAFSAMWVLGVAVITRGLGYRLAR